MKLDYTLHEAGWATAIISDEDKSVRMDATHLHDSLRDLAGAAARIRNGASAAHVLFLDEPSEHYLRFARQDNDQIRVTVRFFEEALIFWGKLPPEEPIVFSAQTTIREVCNRVTTILDVILSQWGLEEYKRVWRHDFPEPEYEQLFGRRPIRKRQ